MELSKRILEILEKSGLTPSEFADKIEVQRSAISHITSGRNKPSLDFLIKIKQAFPEIDTDWLVFGEEKPKENPTSALPEIDVNSTQNEKIPTLFDGIETDENPETRAPVSKKIRRVILLYEDGSFEDFLK
jgi:transcriptional regulator with XRE-family HTH domain